MLNHVGAVRPGGRRAASKLLTCSILAITAAIGSAFPSTARAQDASDSRFVDANGVNLVAGTFEISFVDGAIGSGDAALTLARVRDSAATSGTALQWDNVTFWRATNGGPVGQNATFYVKLPGQFFIDEFTGDRLASTLTSTKGTGATLLQSYGSVIYRAANGTQIEFTDPTGGESATYCQYAYGTSSDPDCPLLLTSITQTNGNSIYFDWELQETGYDPAGVPTHIHRLSTISNSARYRVQLDYAGFSGADWNKRSGARFFNDAVSTSTPQRSISYSYPSAGVTSITDFAGQVWQVTATSIKRPGETTPSLSANSWSAVTSVARDGVSTSYSRSVSGSTGTMVVTDALGHTKTVTSNLTYGAPTSIVDENGKTTTYSYDSYGRQTRVTAPEGNYVNYTYDTRGNITETRRVAKSGSGLSDIVETAAYPSTCANPVTCNQPTSTTDARGNVTSFSYDATHGGVTAITQPAPGGSGTQPETRRSYTYTGGEYRLTGVSACRTNAAPGCVGTSDETKSIIAYDTNGNVTSSTVQAGDGSLSATTAATYSAVGDVLTVDGPLPGTADTTTFRYDAARRRVGVISADPDGGGALKRRAQKASYDIAGRPTDIEIGTVNGTSDTDWAAFASAQKVATTWSGGFKVKDVATAGATYGVTQYSYDGVGRLQCTAIRMNSAAWSSLPSDACTLQTAGSYGDDRITKTTYDNAGRPTKVQTAYGTSAQSDDVTSTYTDNGQIASVTDAEGNKTSYAYDGFDRLSKTSYPGATVGSGTSSGSDYEQLGYDAASNVTSRRLRDGQTITYTYDNLSRVASKATPGSAYLDWDVTYSYNLLGQMVSAAADPGSGVVDTLVYDALGRPIEEHNTAGVTYHAYDLAGRQTRLTWDDGFYVDYDYSVTGEVTAIRENGATSGAGVLATYGYDDLGRRTGVTRGNDTTTAYGFDAVSRLSSLTQDLASSGYDISSSFSYNPASQIASLTRSNDTYAWNGHYNVDRNYTINGLNQMTAAGATSLGYDGRGNLTSSGSSSYGYTVENRLAAAPGYSLAYEPGGGQLMQMRNDTTGQYTRFAYSGGQMIAELNYNGSAWSIAKRYVPGPNVDETVVWYEGSGTSDRRWLHADERGSVVAVTNGSGTPIGVNAFDEYGIPASNTLGRFLYTGQAWLPEIGMYYYKARIYSPTLGRFMQTDPIGYGDGMNWYNYVGSDPVNLIDPSGRCTITNHWIDVYKGFVDGHLEYLGPEPGSGWVEFNGCDDFGGNGGSGSGGIGGGGEPSAGDGEIVVVGQKAKLDIHFNIKRNIPCSAGLTFDLLKTTGAAPRAWGATPLREGLTQHIRLIGDNYISQFVDSSSMIIRNTTERHENPHHDHMFYPGDVVLSVSPNGANNSILKIIGTGTGGNKTFNEYGGGALFTNYASNVLRMCNSLTGA